jgi:Kelch motif
MQLPISNYIAVGAGVNVPSESLGFYFSGLEAPNGVQIVIDATPGELPNMLVSSMIRFDMSDPQNPTGLNLPLPGYVAPRASAELVWIPVSSQGILIIIGGLTELIAFDLSISFTSSDHSSSFDFMTSLPVYDIASHTWFIQNTTGEPPPQRAQFCSIMTNATNSSSFEIYIYGGTDGTSAGTSLGDVWVLSVPSFTWTCVYDGDTTHSRDSHACVRPYPDQMFAVGGQNSANPANPPGINCTDSTIDVFNLTDLTWMSAYDPSNHSEYQIPSAVASNIKATPTASGMNSTLLSLFQQPYSKYITTYYPYATAGPSLSPPPSHSRKSNHLGAILGSVLGVLGFFVIILAIWCFCPPKPGKRSRIQSWINKADISVTTDATLYEVDAGSPRAEAGGSERYEMLVPSPGSPGEPVEMPTPYHSREHPTHPRDSAAAGKPTLASQGRQSSATDSHDLSAPSPNAKPQGSSAVVTDEATPAGSSSVPSPPQSPPFDSSIEQRPSHKRNVSSISSGIPVSASSPEGSPALNTMERNSGLGHSTSRPDYMRNLSSVSSGLSKQLASPTEPVANQRLPSPVAVDSALGTATKEGRNNDRNIAEAGSFVNQQPTVPMPEDDGPESAPETQPLASYETLQQAPAPHNFNRNVVPRKKLSGQSAFKEKDVGTSGPS